MEILQHRSPQLIVQRPHNLNFKLNYLRYDFKNRFCYVILGNMFFDRQNQLGGLTKSDITLIRLTFFGEIWQLGYRST